MARKTMVRLQAPSRVEVLETADVIVGRLAKAAGFDEDAQQDIQVAVHESVVNAIRHGNRGDETLCVTLQIALDAEGLEIRVQDQGRGFDPTGVPDPLAPENLSRSSGRGLLLMRTLMDGVTFRRSRRGTEVTMHKRLSRPVPRASLPEDVVANS